MKILAALLTALIIALNLTAQHTVADSLGKLLQKTVKKDSLRVDLLVQYADELAKTKPASAINFSNEALTLSRKVKYKQGIAKSLTTRGALKVTMSKLVEGYEDYLNALQIYQQLKDQQGKAKVYNGLGDLYVVQEQYTQSLPYYLKAVSIFENNGNNGEIIDSYIKIGSLYEKNRAFSKSLAYFNKALQVAEKTGDKAIAATLYNNISVLYIKTKQFDKSLPIIIKAKQFAEDNNITPDLANAYYNLGTVYSETNQLALSDSNYRKALFFFKQLKNRTQTARTYTSLGKLYFKKYKYVQAKEFLFSANYIATNLNNKELKYDIYTNLAEISKAEGKFLSASKYYERLLALKDTLVDAEKQRSILQLKAAHELDKKQMELQEAKEETASKKRQENFLRLAISTGIILTLLLIVSLIKIARKNQRLNKQESNLADLNGLKDQLFTILGHDLRTPIGNILSTLDVIGSHDYLPKQEKDELVEKLKSSTSSTLQIMDNMLTWGKSRLDNTNNFRKTVRIQEVVERVCEFWQETAENKSIRIINKVTEPLIATADEDQLEFILRNLLSNAIKFSEPGGKVVIRARKLNSYTYIYIRDFGVGMTEAIQEGVFAGDTRISNKGTNGETGSGLGLLLCKEFITQNYGTLAVKSEAGEGTTFSIKLPA